MSHGWDEKDEKFFWNAWKVILITITLVIFAALIGTCARAEARCVSWTVFNGERICVTRLPDAHGNRISRPPLPRHCINLCSQARRGSWEECLNTCQDRRW